MHLPAWFWFAGIAFLTWGTGGLLQKLATNHVSAVSTLIWLVVGFLMLQPWLYPSSALSHYSARSIAWAVAGGLLNAIGAWALFAAFRNGGKASIVAPFTALYPLVVFLVAPVFLRESITLLQVIGFVCAVIAVVLLSTSQQQSCDE